MKIALRIALKIALRGRRRGYAVRATGTLLRALSNMGNYGK
jgi:hypothetical protein